MSIESERRLHTVMATTAIFKYLSQSLGEGRVNIVEICSGLSTHDELSEAWWGGQVQIKSIKYYYSVHFYRN